MADCVEATMQYCIDHQIRKLVMFTGTGQGPMHAIMSGYHPDVGVRIIAVTPPVGKVYLVNPLQPDAGMVRAGISPVTRRALEDSEIAIVSAHLPFQSPPGDPGEHGFRSEWARVERSYAILGEGFSLCIQATLMACDAGHIEVGERVVAMTSATSISILASNTDLFLSPTHGLLVEGWICQPRQYDISHHANVAMSKMAEDQRQLSSSQVPLVPLLNPTTDKPES
jgi:hypothetical protein